MREATVERTLPNRIHVKIVERVPVAFLRTTDELALIDANGVILDRPLDGDFRFPVVSGLDESPCRSTEREKRMRLFVEFVKEIDLVQAGCERAG